MAVDMAPSKEALLPAAVEPMHRVDTPTPAATSPDVLFDPNKHLAYSPPSRILKMQDLAQKPTELSSVAHTEPFPFLSYEGILAHRQEIFKQDTLDNCLHHTRPGSVQIRGLAPRYAPFIHSFWHSPEVLKIVSENAGIDLVPVMDYEICHVNVQMGPDGVEGVRKTPIEPPIATEEAIAAFEKDQPNVDAKIDQTKPVIEWHRDSHPFVCIVMLSDGRHMIGGDTELECGDGRTVRVKPPQMGCATILQGRYITHTVGPSSNMPERVSIVTSFRPRDPTLLDETTNMNIRNKSHLTELYYQWTTYRLDVLAQRAQIAADALRERYELNVARSDPEGKKGSCRVETVDVAEVENWIKAQVQYMEQTLHEMRPLETRNGRVW